MKTQIVFAGLLYALIVVGASGCYDVAETVGGASTEEVNLAITLDEDPSDVAGILYSIACEDGNGGMVEILKDEYVELFDGTIPEWLQPTGMQGMLGGGHLFADLLLLLPPGKCELTAKPRTSEAGILSKLCKVYHAPFEVLPDVPNEVIVLLQCDFDADSLDFLVGLNHGPRIKTLTYNKFPWECMPIEISAVVEDLDLDLINYEWSVVAWPDAATEGEWDLEYTEGEAIFTPITPGDYHLRLKVWDDFLGEATVDFLVHVRDNALIDVCEDVCCQWQAVTPLDGQPEFEAFTDGHGISWGYLPAIVCLELLGGTILGEEMCEDVCCEVWEGSDQTAYIWPRAKCLSEAPANHPISLPGIPQEVELCELTCCFDPDECCYDYELKLFCEEPYWADDCDCQTQPCDDSCDEPCDGGNGLVE